MYKKKLFREGGSFELAHPVPGPGSPGAGHPVPSGRPLPTGPTLTPGSTVVVTHAADIPGLIVNGRHASGSAACKLKGLSKLQLDISYSAPAGVMANAVRYYKHYVISVPKRQSTVPLFLDKLRYRTF